VCPSRDEWQQILEGRSDDDRAGHLDGCSHCRAVVEGLTGGNRTWLDIAAELRRPTPPLPPACRRALEDAAKQAPAPVSRTADIPVGSPVRADRNVGGTGFPVTAAERSATMPARIHIERMMHRSSIAVAGESAVGYTLVKLIPSGPGGGKPMGLNLALALDVSGSMYEEDGTGVSRLQRVQDAAVDAVQKLRPQDTLAVIGFAHNARVLLPSTPVAEKERIEDVIRRIDRCDVDPGGTAMDEGLALALSDLEQHAVAGKLSQVVVLTDGETSGEHNCRALARQAAAKKIHLTLMGVGLDWKASLIKDLASLSQGKWYYIDVHEARETTRVFAEEFESLTAAAFLDVEMRLRPTKDVRVLRVRQVVPEIRELPLEEQEERNVLARLGTLQHDVSSRYILDLSLPARPDGKYVVAQLEVSYDPGTGRRESCQPVPLEMNYTAAGQGPANAEVMKHIDEIRLKEMSDILDQALQNNDQQAARQVAQEIVKQGEVMGQAAARKTLLARQALEELNATGVIRRQTQLALGDAARTAGVTDPPESPHQDRY
jgi:Ca-activated chloride channel family protein